MSLKVIQAVSEGLSDQSGDLLVDQLGCSVTGAGDANVRIDQVSISTVGHRQSPGNLINELWVNILVPFIPKFEWIDVIRNEVFPFDISYDSVGATRFYTDVVRVDSGVDQRSSRWQQPLMEYDISYGVRTLEQLHGLIAFFRVMEGRKYAFLYRDILDCTSTFALDSESRSIPDISYLDQVIAIGDHSTYMFPLIKNYKTPTHAYMHARRITHPEPGTVSVGVAGVNVSNFTANTSTGVITFVSDWAKSGLNDMSISPTLLYGNPVPNSWDMVGDLGTFTDLVVTDKIVTKNWVNPRNNSTESVSLVITHVESDGSKITVTSPSSFGATESNRDGVQVYKHPAPITGASITAGYRFFVPVRFDTDRLPVSLEYYGVGSASEVKLVEVRPFLEV